MVTKTPAKWWLGEQEAAFTTPTKWWEQPSRAQPTITTPTKTPTTAVPPTTTPTEGIPSFGFSPFSLLPFGITAGLEASIGVEQKAQTEEREIEPIIFQPAYTPVVSTKTTPMTDLFAKEYYEQAGIPFVEIVPFKYEAMVFGQSLTHLPTQIAASILQATQGQGGASVANRDWADEYIAEANENLDKFAQDIARQFPTSSYLYEVSQLSRNLAYSVTSMGAGLAVGLPTAFIPLPGARVAAWVAGSAASGAVAYQMTTYQIMQEYLELKNTEKIEQTGVGITIEEENKLKEDFHDLAVKYGLWEAVPEAISNLLFGQLLLGPLGKMIGGPMATQIIMKLAGMYGEEFLTETITQKGQSAIEVEAGLREGNIGWVEAFKEIAPQTFLLTTIMGGAGQVAVSSTQGIQKIRNSLKNEIGEGHPLYAEIKKGIETETETIIAPTVAESGQSFTATAYRGVTEVPTDEGLVGKAQYWTTDPAYAATYGPVTESTVTLKNPLAINTQADWDALGYRTRELRDIALEQGRDEDWVQTELRNQLEAEGYDGVVIAEGIVETGKQVAVFHPEMAVVTPGIEFKPITTKVGKGYEILQNNEVVGTVSYSTEVPGVDGIVMDRIDIAEAARRQGLATQAIQRILSEAESQGVPLYTGIMEPDGVQLFNALEQRGIVSLTPAPERMLGNVVTRGVPEYAPTTAMAEWETISGKEVTPVTPEVTKLTPDELQNITDIINTGVFKDNVAQTIQKDGQKLLDAIKQGDTKTINSLMIKYQAEVTKGITGAAGPKPLKPGRVGGSDIWNAAKKALDKMVAIPKAKIPTKGKIIPKVTPVVEPESLSIPEKLPTTPPPITPEGKALGRTDNEWTGFMKDLQDANTLADVAFREDVLRKLGRLPVLRGIFEVVAPNVVANTPAGKYVVIRATLIDEGGQKSQGVIAHLQEVGTQNKVFGAETAEHTIKSGSLKGYSVGYIAEHRGRFEAKLTPEQRLWLDRANKIEQAITEFLIKHGIDINKVSLEEGGQFATRRVYARILPDGTILEVGFVGAAPGRPGARLPTEKHRQFKDEAEAIKNGYRYIPYEEALYLRLTGAYRRVANQKSADWLLTQVEWRTTGAPEELILAAESARKKLRHSQMLLAALNRAVRGERVPGVTTTAIATSYPNQAQALKDLIPRIQAGETTARDVQRLTRTAKGLISTNRMSYARAVSQRARAREAAMATKVGEAMIPAPAFQGKILTGPDAKETMQTVMDSFRPQFSKVLGEINKFNAVVRYYMLAGDISYPSIQLIFMMGENPKAFTQTMAGAIHSILDPKFHDSQIAKFKDVIDRHPNMMLSIRGRTEMTEAMAKGGWLSGEANLFPQGERYIKKLGLLVPRSMGKGMGKLLTPFQRGMEGGLDLAGIYLALANEHMAKTPAELADLDQWINEFRGLTSSSRMGVTGLQRQRERGAVLAPQYNRAIAGLLWSLTRGGLRGHLARRSLARGITAIVIMTVLISLLRGEDKDEIIEHLNPNSANFVTWDIAGQKIGPGSKVRSLLKLFAQSARNPDDLVEFSMDNPALRFLRGNASPTVSSAVDLITGKSYIGDPTRDGMLSFSKELLAGNLLPIWVQSTLLEGGSPGGRTARGLAEFFGWRAFPEPLWDEVRRLRGRYAQQDFRMEYEDLNRAQIDALGGNHPDLVELEEKARLEQAERGNEFEYSFYLMREEAVNERNGALENAATLLLDGTITKYDYDKERGYARPYYSGGMAVLYGLRDRLDPKAIKDIQEWLSENQKPEDKALDAYQEHRASLIEKSDLPRDWDTIEEQCNAYLAKLFPKIREYVKTNLSRWINDLPENAKQIELMRLQGIENETWWDDYRGTSGPGEWWSGGPGGGVNEAPKEWWK